MKTKKCTLPLVEQKAIVLDCMEKVAHVRREIARLFPMIEKIRDTSIYVDELSALRIYENHTIGACSDLADIYGCLVEKEVSHE